ncbi:MAG TPA: LysR family transcriptional regulator [Sedimenticola thiotaurini]|uniref:LysR family transcriptional regulator n=1 Tax=Sedimenticola thiotaurini TaxID=1543721 RepID=A0A831RJT8_9GAMM|nr:LysR family transcriptional regulator [Sedimenticola thiotaurini]
MEINELAAFVAVAETGSFSRAAERLFLTQPAVSKRIAGLEGKLATRLFDRIGHRIHLTEAGRQLLPRARSLLLEIRDIERGITNLSGEIGGTLRMGTSHHIGLRRLPPVLKHYSRSFPRVKLDIRFLDSESACAAVEQGELELAVVTLPPAPSPVLELTRIWHDRLRFVVAADHPLAGRRRVTLADLAGFPAVLAAHGTYTRGILEQAMAPLGLSLQVGMATNYLETLKMMVSIGLGWSLLPESMLDDPGLRPLQLPEMALSRELGVVVHRHRVLSNAAREMLESCRRFRDPPDRG